MLHRLILHVALVFLFAFTQIGVGAHEISHVSNHAQQSKQDQHKTTEQCGQCLAYAQAAAGTLVPAFVFALPATHFQFSAALSAHHSSLTLHTYRARAPPFFLI